ncbi:MAG: glycine zipper 2TM domain-containing protein [Gemmatimonadetes bacterium]|nr:glycine zipper 2TM domain-containing protein [Gemmatimonadota bacterium]
MRSLKLTLASLLLAVGALTACQQTEDEELAETSDTTVIAVPETADAAADARAVLDSVESARAASAAAEADRPERIVVVREEAPPEPRRTARRRPVEEPEPRERENRDETPRPAPRPLRATVPAGTNFFVTTETDLSTKTNQVGDPVAARTAENVNVDGQVVIPAGALVEGHVTAINGAGNPGEVAYIDLAFDRVRLANGEWLPVSGALAGKAGEEVRGSANIPRNVAIGAGAGAVLGQVIGGDTKSTVIGAVIGAGAGAAAGEATRDSYVVVPAGSRLNVQLTSAASVPLR